MQIVGDTNYASLGETNLAMPVQAGTRLGSGGFVLATGRGTELSAQIYDAEGRVVGSPVAIAASAVFSDLEPLPGGGFAVAWREDSPSGTFLLKTRVFSSDGVPVGAETVVGETRYLIDGLSLSARSDGSYVVSWLQVHASFTRTEVYARTVDGSGTPYGDLTQVAAAASSLQSLTLQDGRTLIAFSTPGMIDLSPSQPQAVAIDIRSFDTGIVGATGFARITLSIDRGYAAVDIDELANGQVLVSWTEQLRSGGDTVAIRGQIYNADGTTTGHGFTTSSRSFFGGQVQALDSGGFIVTSASNTPGDQLMATVFDDEARQVGESFVVNDTKLGSPRALQIIPFGDDDFVAAYAVGSASTFAGVIRTYFSTVKGADAADTLDGTPAADVLVGGAGDDILRGQGGDDRLIGGPGADRLEGGAGTDTALYDNSNAAVTIDLTLGTALGGEAAGDVLVSVENVSGSAFADVITGDATANELLGNAGNDTLVGGLGADRLDSGGGNDILYGDLPAPDTGTPAGNDALYGGSGNDLLAGGRGDDVLSGGDGNDVLVSGVASNLTFSGPIGLDLLTDGGNDVIDGGAGSDTAFLTYDRADGITLDLSTPAAVSAILSSGIAAGSITNVERLGFTGGSGADVVTGGASTDLLDGRGGNDTLTGGAGDDRLTGGLGNDLLDGGDGVDVAVIVAASGSAGLTWGADGALTVTSADGADTLRSIETLRFTDRDVAATNLSAIDAAYRSLGGRAASSSELILWADVIAGGGSVGGVRTAIINDALGAQAIDAEYRKGFGRSASGEEIAIWRGAFLQGSDLGTLRGAIASGVASMNATVNALYRDYGGRAASAFEVDLWRGQLIAGVSADTIRSVIINDALGAQAIDTAYQQGFGRSASAGEIAIWRGAFQQGADLGTLRGAIASGVASMNATVNALYEDYGGRPANTFEVDLWRGQLIAGVSADTIRSVIINDALGAQAIDTAYQQGFGRSASAGEIAIWRGAFQQGADLDTLRAVILSQPAGQAHATAVIRASYQDYFARAADDADLSAWLGLFARGGTTDTLRDTLMTHPAASAGGVARYAAGAGADTIVFNSEHLVVTGFDPVADTIDLRGSALGGSNPLAFAREVVSLDGRHDVLIDTPEHDLLLTGVTLAQLSAADFLI